MKTLKPLEIGQKIGKLTILKFVADQKVDVVCDCGALKTISRRSIKQGSATSCGNGKCHARYRDLDGQRFGKLLVLKSDLPNSKVLVVCDCGTKIEVQKSSLTAGKSTSCGKGFCHAATIDLTGKTFGYLIVTKFVEGKSVHGYGTLWECICVCGKTHQVVSHSLVTGQTKSCGCKTGEIYSNLRTIPDNGAIINAIYASYKLHAKKLNINFLLTLDEFKNLIQSPCYYCGDDLSNVRTVRNKFGNSKFYYNGIDRKDSVLDYVSSNCVTACKNCNLAKRKLSHDRFIELVKKIAENFK